jgi:hypothetical protein
VDEGQLNNDPWSTVGDKPSPSRNDEKPATHFVEVSITKTRNQESIQRLLNLQTTTPGKAIRCVVNFYNAGVVTRDIHRIGSSSHWKHVPIKN